jgi:hypothetical protein
MYINQKIDRRANLDHKSQYIILYFCYTFLIFANQIKEF